MSKILEFATLYGQIQSNRKFMKQKCNRTCVRTPKKNLFRKILVFKKKKLQVFEKNFFEHSRSFQILSDWQKSLEALSRRLWCAVRCPHVLEKRRMRCLKTINPRNVRGWRYECGAGRLDIVQLHFIRLAINARDSPHVAVHLGPTADALPTCATI